MQSPYSGNYRLTVKESSEIAVVFATDQMISKMKGIEVIHFDATFRVVLRLFYQLATIFIRVRGHAIPALHILMTAKNEQLCTAVITAVRDYIPEINPLIVMCDFEKASRNAFISLFPYINIVGCWFHFSNMIKYKTRSWKTIPSKQRVQKLDPSTDVVTFSTGRGDSSYLLSNSPPINWIN